MRDYALYLKDILAAMESIETFVDGMDAEEFQSDDKTASAVLRKLEVIGEAVKHLPDDLRRRYVQVPWKEMAGMRDKLIHFYFGVDYRLIWITIKERLSRLDRTSGGFYRKWAIRKNNHVDIMVRTRQEINRFSNVPPALEHQIAMKGYQTKLPDLPVRVAAGEDIVIQGEGGDAYKMIPFHKPAPRFGGAKGLSEISENFDEPVKDLRRMCRGALAGYPSVGIELRLGRQPRISGLS